MNDDRGSTARPQLARGFKHSHDSAEVGSMEGYYMEKKDRVLETRA